MVQLRAMDVGSRVLLLCVVVALTMILVTLRNSGPRTWLPLAISFSLVLISFGVGRLFMNKLTIHQYSMNWSANGVAPWGPVQTNEKGESPVVIYRRVEGGYCYDAIFSTELKTRLSQTNKPIVAVEYNIFSDFGREHGYNIRTVNGMAFNEGDRNFYGGYVETDAAPSAQPLEFQEVLYRLCQAQR